MTGPTEDTFDESISSLIELGIRTNSEKASILFSKCEEAKYHGWDIKIIVGLPGSLE